MDEDVVWSGNRVADTPSGPMDSAFASEGPEAFDYVISKEGGKDKTEAFQEIAGDSRFAVVKLEPGLHIVTEPIVFGHHVTFVGPRSAGGSKAGRPKVLFDLSQYIQDEGIASKKLTGFTFEAGADLQRVTFKGGAEKGDAGTTVNVLQFGKKGADNEDVSAHMVGCNIGELKRRRGITHYGTSSHFEGLSFSDAPGAGTTAIDLRSNTAAPEGARHDILQNTFHLGGGHTSVRKGLS